jgi:hypothetical protein
LKQFAIGLAAGINIDATLIRALLVSSLMRLIATLQTRGHTALAALGPQVGLLEDREIELGEPLWVGEEVQRDDLPASDRDRTDRERFSVAQGDASDGTVDESRPILKAETRVEERLPGHESRPPHDLQFALDTEVLTQYDVGVE